MAKWNSFQKDLLIITLLGILHLLFTSIFPLKGMEVTSQTWIGGLILNGFWGLGVAIFLTLLGARRLATADNRRL